MVDSEKSNTDYPTFDFRPSHVQHVRTSPRNASIAVSSFASAKALLDVLPEGNLSLTSTLTIWSKDISQPARLPELSSTSFESNWFDHNCYENLSVHGTLNATGMDPNSSLWQEWCNWLTTAGVLIEFCEIPKNCPQQLRFIPDPLYRWIYFVHEFVAPDLFTWDLTPEQLDEWKQRCDEVGFGDFHHTAAEDDGTWSYHLGAGAGKRLPLAKLYSFQWLPYSFHVCSEIQNLIYESRKLLSVLGPRLLRPDDDVASDSQREMAAPVRLVVAKSDDGGATMETTASAPNTQQPKRPKQKSFESFKYQFVLKTQSDIAEAVYGDRSKQSKVSRDIAAVETYLAACGLSKDEWKVESAKPEFITWDSRTIDLGKRQDSHTESQREKFEEFD